MRLALILFTVLFFSAAIGEQSYLFHRRQHHTGSSVDPAADYMSDWLTRISDAGGAAPSGATVSAVTTLVQAVIDAGITNKMLAMNPVVPDNLIAAITPVIRHYGAPSWTNVNFVAGDINTEGLTGGATKYLKTGIPGNAFTDGAAGVTFYIVTNKSELKREFGALDDGTHMCELYMSWSAATYWDAFNGTGGAGRLSGYTSTAGTNVFYSCNRVSATSNALFVASSVHAFSAVMAGTGSGGTEPTDSMYWVYGSNSYDVGRDAGSSKTHSFIAIHDGLTYTEAEALYDAVQAYRTTIGGGYR